MRIVEKIREKQESRMFEIPGFSLIDLLNPYYIDRKTIYDFIVHSSKKYVQADWKILDFGCGSKPYKRLFQCEKYIGCDIAESGHDEEDKMADVFYDGHTLPFEAESFDAVLSTQVMEHVEYFDEVFREIVRILKKNGIIIMSIPFAGEEHEQPYDFRRFTSFGIRSIFEKNGFEILELRKSTDYKNTIRFIRCIYRDNAYRKNKSIYNFVCRYLQSIITNLIFILNRKNMKDDEDLSISLLVVGRKRNG